MLLIAYLVLWDVLSKNEGEGVSHVVNPFGTEMSGLEKSCPHQRGPKKRGVLQFEGPDFVQIPRNFEEDNYQVGTVDALGELLEELKEKTEESPELSLKGKEMGYRVSNFEGSLEEYEPIKVTPCRDLRERFFRLFPGKACLIAHNWTGKAYGSVGSESGGEESPQTSPTVEECSKDPFMKPYKTEEDTWQDTSQEQRFPFSQIFSSETSLCVPIKLVNSNKFFSSESSGEDLSRPLPLENSTIKESPRAKCQKGNVDGAGGLVPNDFLDNAAPTNASCENAIPFNSNCTAVAASLMCTGSSTSVVLCESSTLSTSFNCINASLAERNCSTFSSTPRNNCTSSSTVTCAANKTSPSPCNSTTSTCASSGPPVTHTPATLSNGTCNNTTPACVTPSTCKFMEKLRKRIGALFSWGNQLDHLGPSMMELQKLSLKLLEQGQAIKDFVQASFKPEALKTKLDEFRQTICQMRNITVELEVRNASYIKISLRDKAINDTDRSTTYFTFN